MRISLNRLQVDEALEARETDLATFVETGKRQGKNIEEIAADLQSLTGVPFTSRTLYRWVEDLKVAS
jgi:hypothetical protein